MKIYLVRHGETDLNSPVRRMQGSTNISLNDNGRMQAKDASLKLKDLGFDLIIASPYKRAFETASIINEVLNIELITDDRIKERDYGDLEGMPYLKEYCNIDYDLVSVHGEEYNHYKDRLLDFLSDIKKKYSDKKVLVVCHNGVIGLLSCLIEGMPDDRNYVTKGIPNGEIKELII